MGGSEKCRMIVCTRVVTRARHPHSTSCLDIGDRFSPTDEGMDRIQRVPFRVRYPSREKWWSQGLARQDLITEFPVPH